MSCPSCPIALAGPGPLDTITSRIGRTGTIVALGATGALIGYVLGKYIGTAVGVAAGAGAAWYLTRDGAEAPVNELPPSVSVPPQLAPAPSVSVLPRLMPAPVTSSSTISRLSAGGGQQLRCWSR